MSLGSALLLTGLGCVGQGFEMPSSEKETLVDISHTLTLDSTTALGPHRLLSKVERSDLVGTQAESLELVFHDWENLRATWGRNGRPVRRTQIHEGRVFGGPVDSMRAFPDAGTHLGELRSTWDLYTRALEPFAERLDYQYVETVEIEGRTAWRYTLGLTPGTDPKRGLAPRSLSGHVTLDKATAVRLDVALEGTLWDPEVDSERRLSIAIHRDEIGVLSDLQGPAPSEVRLK